jgi:hypothetical protein
MLAGQKQHDVGRKCSYNPTLYQSGKQPADTRAQVIDNARERWDKDADKAALRKRVTFAGGDFFKQGAAPLAVPEHTR